MKRAAFVVLVCAAAAGMAQSGTPACVPSALWGNNGERWKPEVNLPDFSYAGYRAGEAPIPSPENRYDLKRDFHAAGDGRTDDTDALAGALRAITGGVLWIPEGTYVITRRIEINKGDVVLRGAGRGRTVLLFPRSLTDVYGNRMKDGQSDWSFGPGFLTVRGRDPITPATRLAAVTEPARRGERTLTLSAPVSIEPGEWIRLVESDPPSGSLIHFLYGERMPAGPGLVGTKHVVRFLSRVSSVSGNSIVLERALPYDVRPEWTPEIHRFRPSVQEFGIEHLSIRFPWTPYPGHFREQGYNGINVERVANCWIDDIEIENSDYGIGLDQANFFTIRDVAFRASANRGVDAASKGWSGHQGIFVGNSTETLITGFDFQTKFGHDASVEWYDLHTVFARGRGVDLNLDHHREANYASLFTNLDCGAGTRVFVSGGSEDRGAFSGAYTTYWNLRAHSPLAPPPGDFGPLLIMTGVEWNAAPSSKFQWTVEPISPSRLCPTDLYEAMRNRRLRAPH